LPLEGSENIFSIQIGDDAVEALELFGGAFVLSERRGLG